MREASTDCLPIDALQLNITNVITDIIRSEKTFYCTKVPLSALIIRLMLYKLSPLRSISMISPVMWEHVIQDYRVEGGTS